MNYEGFYTGAFIQYHERISNNKAYFDLQSLDFNQEIYVGNIHVIANSTVLSNDVLK